MPSSRLLRIESLECRRLLAFDPTAAEQEFMQLTNRFRTDPQGEFTRLFTSTTPLKARDPIFQFELDYFGVSGTTLKNELQALSPAPPVAWNEAVYGFARSHNEAMINSSPPAQFHSNSTVRLQALRDAGVSLRSVAGELIMSENVYGYAKSPVHLFAGYLVDWGTGTGGMQTNRPHRGSFVNRDYDQVGQAITNFSGSNFGPLVNTQVFVNINSPPVMVVGSVFEDKNDSGWYDAGEGIRAPSVQFVGAAGTFTTQGLTAGGYQIELPPGTYTAIASGGGMKHSVIVSNIVVGTTNVWQNLIYDPNAIPADSLESNNSTASATATTGRDQAFSGLSIHTAGDVDYFRFEPQGTGGASFKLQFVHAAGNLDLRLLSATGSTIATSSTTSNTETITANVTRGTTYYVRVYSVGGAVNGSYSLTINAPEPRPAVAAPDRGSVSSDSRSLTLNILANDTDPDGDRTKLAPRLAANTPASMTLTSTNRVQYTAPANFSGFQRTTYTIVDDQGLISAPATIEFLVINFADTHPWQNKFTREDVNGDGRVTPLDVLIIINDLNANGFRRLPTSGSVQSYVGLLDTNGDSMASPADILTVINRLNSLIASGEAAGEMVEELLNQSGRGPVAVFAKPTEVESNGSADLQRPHPYDLAIRELFAFSATASRTFGPPDGVERKLTIRSLAAKAKTVDSLPLPFPARGLREPQPKQANPSTPNHPNHLDSQVESMNLTNMF